MLLQEQEGQTDTGTQKGDENNMNKDIRLKDTTSVEFAQAIRQIYRRKQSLENLEGRGEEAIELVVSPVANAARLLRFMCQLEEKLDDKHESILHTVGSWKRGTIITILLQPARLSVLLNKLGNMYDLEKVEEEPLESGGFSSFPAHFGVLPRLSISPSKRVRVTLKQTGVL